MLLIKNLKPGTGINIIGNTLQSYGKVVMIKSTQDFTKIPNCAHEYVAQFENLRSMRRCFKDFQNGSPLFKVEKFTDMSQISMSEFEDKKKIP